MCIGRSLQDATAASACGPPHAGACDAEEKSGGISLDIVLVHPVPERSRAAATPLPGGLPCGHERQDPMQSQPTCQPAASDAGPLDVESEEGPAGLYAGNVQRSSASSSCSSSSSSSSDTDASMCQEMMFESPYFMTALSLDSRKIYQSPRSIRSEMLVCTAYVVDALHQPGCHLCMVVIGWPPTVAPYLPPYLPSPHWTSCLHTLTKRLID